jgi:signal transduction histidine kinase
MVTNGSKTEESVIIVTDDHRATRHMIRSILATDHVKVIEARNGSEAIELFSSTQPDLILLDVMMPVMGGFEACTHIKKMAGGNQVPVLMFTASNEGKEMEQAFQAGASDFINKPINAEELRHRVSRLLYLRMLETKREADELEIQSSYEQIQTLSIKVLYAYEEERVRLARELHDELGMALTTLKLNLQLLNNDFASKGSELEKRLASCVGLADNSLIVIRNKGVFMRPPALDNLGLVAVVSNMVSELSRLTSIHAKLKTTGKYTSLPVEVETALYRCIQEALTNVVRHSSAENVVVTLACNHQEVSIRVKDDGIGFHVDSGCYAAGHLGLQGMRERVALLGGKLEINSFKGIGTDILITTPLEKYRRSEKPCAFS